ncbi:hypothetical protein Poli38472_000112 [Pythium oligandrum]|uniref:Ankyrin repeat protein n=1 Tax=Pythium oligandrum TaxID=41045 RepID=A0A8K1CBH8_PYTOL|nr:hypothetical protein Poli38472_000112 [Pythium oligandrum]|eukprot:TMW60070.1 hypothetical protein Poli38472_000112 [Pythium oligandrum]
MSPFTASNTRLDILRTFDFIASLLCKCLCYEDKFSLLVSAYDLGLEELIRYLEYEDETSVFPRDLVLEVAAAHGCVYALHRLLRPTDLRAFPGLEDSTKKYSPRVWTELTRVMQWLNLYRPAVYSGEAMIHAAIRGDMEAVEWLHSTSAYDIETALSVAVKHGNFDVVEWLVAHQSTALHRLKDHKGGPKKQVEVVVGTNHALFQQRLFHWVVRLGGLTTRWFGLRRRVDGIETFTVREFVDRWRATLTHSAAVMDPLCFAVSLGETELAKSIYEDESLRPDHSEAIAVAAQRGDVDLMDWLRNACDYTIPPHTLDVATCEGHANVVEWLENSGGTPIDIPRVLDMASQHGRLSLVQRMCERIPTWKFQVPRTMVLADPKLSARFRDVLDWLHDEDKLVEDANVLSLAVECGANRVVKARVDAKTVEWHRARYFLRTASQKGQLAVMQSLLEARPDGQPLDSNCLRNPFLDALTSGHRDVAEFILTNYPEQCSARGHHLLSLVCHGRMDMAKMIYDPDDLVNIYAWESQVKESFALFQPRYRLRYLLLVDNIHVKHQLTHDSGRREFVQWCLSDRLFRDTEYRFVAQWAVQIGDLDLVREIIALGVDPEIGYKDVDANNREVLGSVTTHTKASDIVCTILRQSPSLIGKDVVEWAAKHRRMKVLECIEELIAEGPKSLVNRLVLGDRRIMLHSAIVAACEHGHVEVLEWARHSCGSLLENRRHKTSPSGAAPATDKTVKEGAEETGVTSEKLVIHSVDPWRRAARTAEEFGHLHVLKWLDAQGMDSDRGVRGYDPFANGAYRHGHLAVVIWLWEKHMANLKVPVGEKSSRAFKRGLRHAIEYGHTDLTAWMIETAASIPLLALDADLLMAAEKAARKHGVHKSREVD